MLKRLDAFNIMALLVLLGLVLFIARSNCGAELGVGLSPGGYVNAVQGPQNGEEEILVNDRLVSLAGRQVSSLAEIGAVLRTLDPEPVADSQTIEGLEARLVAPQVPVILERYNYRFGETLSHGAVSESGFPSSIQKGDRVVGYDGREVSGNVDLNFVSEELAREPEKTISVLFERDVHSFSLKLPLKTPPFGPGQVILFVAAFGVIVVLGWRSRNALVASNSLDPWALMAAATAMLPWVLLLLGDPVWALRDPLLLLIGLTCLAFYRPAMLELNRKLMGVESTYTTFVILLPALVVAFLGLFFVFAIMPSMWGGAVAAEEEFQVVDMIKVSVAVLVGYHLLDLALWFSAKTSGRAQALPKWTKFGLLLSTLAVVSAGVHFALNAEALLGGSFVIHAAALVLVLWLGNLSLLAVIPGMEPDASSSDFSHLDSEEKLLSFFKDVALLVHPDDPVLVVVRGKAAWRIEADALGEAPTLEVKRAADTLRDAVGVFRDERVALPVYHAEEEPSGSVAVVEGVAQAVGITTAFGLLDEAEQVDGMDHHKRERAFFVFCVIEGGSYAVQPHEMSAVREGFAGVWPQTRHLVVETIMESAEHDDQAAQAAPLEAVNLADAPEIETPEEDLTTVELFARPAEEGPVSTESDPEGPEPSATEAGQTAPRAAAQPASMELPYLRRDLAEAYPVEESDLIEPVLEHQVNGLVGSEAPIIVMGPTGIGKEFIARRFHRISSASEGPFIKFNVSTCPPSLRALELLGEGPREGHLGAAAGGVLFVEDVAELEETILTRLLKSSGEQDAPTRLVLSVRTHFQQSLKEAVNNLEGSLGEMARGMFSHRIITLDPLHCRPLVLRSIIDHYLHFFSMKHNRVITDFSVDAIEAILRRRWPGGVMELKSVVEAAVLRCDSDTLALRHLGLGAEEEVAPTADAGSQALQLWVKTAPDLREALWVLQELVYLEALEREEGNKSAAARLVGVKRTTFIRRLKEHGRFDE